MKNEQLVSMTAKNPMVEGGKKRKKKKEELDLYLDDSLPEKNFPI